MNQISGTKISGTISGAARMLKIIETMAVVVAVIGFIGFVTTWRVKRETVTVRSAPLPSKQIFLPLRTAAILPKKETPWP